MLDRMIDRPDRIPSLLGEFRDNIGALGEWITNTESQPLQIDYIIVASRAGNAQSDGYEAAVTAP